MGCVLLCGAELLSPLHATEFRVLNFWLNHLSSIRSILRTLLWCDWFLWRTIWIIRRCMIFFGISLVSKIEFIWHVRLIMRPVTLECSLQITHRKSFVNWHLTRYVCQTKSCAVQEISKWIVKSCWIWSIQPRSLNALSVDINHYKIAFCVFAVDGIDSLKMTPFTQYELFQLCQLFILQFFLAIFIHSFPSFVILAFFYLLCIRKQKISIWF